MKRYAVKVIEGQEFLQSKNNVIDLGDLSLEKHKKVIDILNTKNPLSNLLKGQKYILETSKDACFDLEFYTEYKMIYRKNSISMKRVCY